MGTFTATLEVGNLNGAEFASVEALVDTGAYYTMVDRDLLESLSIQPTEQVDLYLADGSVVEYDMALRGCGWEERRAPLLWFSALRGFVH